jgi:hypothetical protein
VSRQEGSDTPNFSAHHLRHLEVVVASLVFYTSHHIQLCYCNSHDRGRHQSIRLEYHRA